MTFLNQSPSSLKSLAQTAREKAAPFVQSIQIDPSSGFLVVNRSATLDSVEYYYHQADLGSSNSQLEKVVGTENLAFLDAIRKLLATDTGKKIDILIFSKEGMYIVYDGVGNGGRTEVESFLSNELSRPYSIDRLTPSVQYGDNERRNFTGTPLFTSDILVGWDGSDSLFGLLGDDELLGKGGNDELYGGYGNDKLNGGDGDDYLYGEQGNDRLEGSNGDDYLDGGLGVDTMIGGAGNDTYLIDRTTDIIIDSGTSADRDAVLIPVFLTYTLPAVIEDGELTGNYNSNLAGNALNNDLIGNGGNNILNGGAGADEITGGLGNDVLIGGIGNDDLVGGTGKDLFRFTSSVTTGTSGQGTDEIIDFQKGIDKIQIQKSGFKVGTAAITSVVISNSTNNTFGSGANFHFNTATSDLFFKGQTTAIADVLGVTSLSAGDFSLI